MPLNAISTENQKPGNPASEWDLGGAASPTIEGFATRMSVNRGTTVQFKIRTTSSNYRIDVYRLGYYAGLGARKVATIQRNTPSPQPAPGGDPAIGLYDAGNWSVTASWAVPADAVSGVYLAKLVRQDGVAGASHIPFVVRADGTQHDLVFQTSDTTWHAYNGWGGANLYGGNATASPNGRAYKVSYNRPIGTRHGVGLAAGPQDYVMSAEYAAIRWLERNGYDVTYLSAVDVGPGNVPLTQYKAFLSTGHDEYWSGDQHAHVQAARDAGVHLVFMSGNEVYWKTRWEPDLNGTPGRTLVCYKETWAGSKIDPSPEWTGTWRDPSLTPPADGGRPENSLTGTIFQVDSYRYDVIEVPHPMTRLRFWRDTQVALTAPGGTAELVPGLLGYEWDESPNNRFRPPGLVRLSSTALDVHAYLVDYGLTTAAAHATHHLTLYRAPSGAIVFGAGTVFWTFGLDATHDETSNGTYPAVVVDRDVQQAMVNLFADMTVQPTTPQADLVVATASTDVTAPTAVIAAPANGATVVQQQKVVVSGTASDVGGVVAAVEVSTDGGTSWRAARGTANWSFDWWPHLPGQHAIRVRAVDDSLNVQSPAASVAVTVTPSASVRLFDPSDVPFTLRTAEHAALELGVRFSVNTAGSATGVRFYKNPHVTGSHEAHLWSGDGTLLASAAFSGETASGWQQANFPAPVALSPGATYVASYHNVGFYSADSNYFTSARTGGAVTAPAGDNGVFAYGASGTFPANTFRSTNYWVDVVFARAGGAGNLPPVAGNDGGFTTNQGTAIVIPAAALLANDTDPNGYPLSVTGADNPVNGTVTWSAASQAVTFTPSAGFSGLATFRYTITNGRNAPVSATVSVSVLAAAVRQTLFKPADTPAIAGFDDPHPINLGVKFRCSAPGAKAKGVRFYKAPQNSGTHAARLWTANGVLLASATFSGETASGWQEATFPAPVDLTADTTYVASYHTAAGNYAVTGNFFANAVTRGALVAPSSGSSGGNGVFAYGPSPAFPTSSFNATNYWVDVVVDAPSPLLRSLFEAGDAPAVVTVADSGPVQLGTKFRTSATDATAVGLRFYKGPQNTGTHTGHLWTASGVLLASATFSGETASGWQQVVFGTPVPLTADTTYVASYHTNAPYSATGNFFGTDHVKGTLTGLSSAGSGGNGVFTYGPAGSFPSSSFNATNYWVDVVVRSS
ncbi:uncharacterized protein DUF4082 [Saccharothrix carnea]|uniref:Uncharacterized protein DUF4082 n=1 Tax=Saccharothrix carnea TaxID=1280637 RepID=A0A2P8ICN7_SACCR|nr:DUF4082 domain-containing protein [Saccharothrix carnea]PSL56232.1 uncharacterized protein DUF4082 [Saccharothrix carnea]